jgi:N6-L-threonylcarbamoyladenine synthase
MNRLFLGIDTSNYTTSASVADENGRILKNVKRPLPVSEGERGLRQSDAVFAHIKNIPSLFEELGRVDFDYIGYSAYPRDAEGSYMPCFETGHAVASAISAVCGKECMPFSHQAGHIRAALYSSGKDDLRYGEFLAFHVSGGTTELLHVQNGKIELVGETLDLNAGQAVDRIGVLLGLKFPCGPALESMAGDAAAPKPKICVKGTDCNLSGLENKAKSMIESGEGKSVIAAYTLDFIAHTIFKMTINAREKYGNIPVIYAGGVMSNKRIRRQLEKNADTYFAAPEFSCDNAAGCALLCRDLIVDGKR